MLWWIDPGTATVVQATRAQATQQALFGPYETRAAALAALAGARPQPKPPPRASVITGQAAVAAARAYIGRWTYIFGGTPNPPRVLEGDCSSFVSMILGYRLRLALPGGSWGKPGFPPNSHGPDVADYIAWHGAETISTPQAGDLVCYGPNEHIGFVIDADTFVSALNPSLGVRIEPIRGGASGDIIYRRVTGIAGVGLPLPVGAQSTAGTAAGPLIAIIAFAATALGVFGLAVLGAAVAIPLIARKVMS